LWHHLKTAKMAKQVENGKNGKNGKNGGADWKQPIGWLNIP